MGLAPYGEPKYVDLIYEYLIDVKDDGSFRLDMRYFNYATGLTMTNRKFDSLFQGKPRKAEWEITAKEMDIARSIQVVTEETIMKLAKTIKQELDSDNLCLAGGVALNCVANGRLSKERVFKDIWVQPAAGDAGGAVGSAYSVWHEYLGKKRSVNGGYDQTCGSYLGPRFTNEAITEYLETIHANYEKIDDRELMPKLAEILEAVWSKMRRLS